MWTPLLLTCLSVNVILQSEVTGALGHWIIQKWHLVCHSDSLSHPSSFKFSNSLISIPTWHFQETTIIISGGVPPKAEQHISSMYICFGFIRIWLFSHESKVRNLNDHSSCEFWMIIRMTVFWTVCTQNYIAMRNLKCAIQMMVRRCFPVTHLSNYAAKSPYECLDLKIVIWGRSYVTF